MFRPCLPRIAVPIRLKSTFSIFFALFFPLSRVLTLWINRYRPYERPERKNNINLFFFSIKCHRDSKDEGKLLFPIIRLIWGIHRTLDCWLTETRVSLTLKEKQDANKCSTQSGLRSDGHHLVDWKKEQKLQQLYDQRTGGTSPINKFNQACKNQICNRNARRRRVMGTTRSNLITLSY